MDSIQRISRYATLPFYRGGLRFKRANEKDVPVDGGINKKPGVQPSADGFWPCGI